MSVIKEVREFFLRASKVSTGLKRDRETNYPTTHVVKGNNVGNRFLESHYPSEDTFKKFLESVTFKLNPEDTATTSMQGLSKKCTDTKAISKDSTDSENMTTHIQPHQIPDVEALDESIIVTESTNSGSYGERKTYKLSKGTGWYTHPDFSDITRIDDNSFSVTDNATNQAIFTPGRPLNFVKTSAVAHSHFAIVTGYSSGTVTISGAAYLATNDKMYYGDYDKVHTEQFVFDREISTGSAVIDFGTSVYGIDSWIGVTPKFKKATGYLVNIETKATGIGVTTWAGLQVKKSASSGTNFTYSDWTLKINTESVGKFDVTEYNFVFNDSIYFELDNTQAGADGGNLNVALTFILP